MDAADLHSVIDHLSDVSKQKQSDKEAAESLSFVDAFQQQAKVGPHIYFVFIQYQLHASNISNFKLVIKKYQVFVYFPIIAPEK